MTLAYVLVAALIAAPGATQTEARRLILTEQAAADEEPGAPRWTPPLDDTAAEVEAPDRSKVAPAIVMGASIVALLIGSVFLSKTIDALDRTEATLGVGLN